VANQNLTSFDAVMKNYYAGPIVSLLNDETYMLDQIEQQHANDFGTFTGRQVVFPTRVSRNRGRGATTDGGSLAAAGAQGYLDGIVNIRYLFQGIELTDMVIEQSKTDIGAFTRALTSETDRATIDLRKDVQRMVFGTGDGVLANCTAANSTNTQQVDSGQYIAVGDTVDILTKSNGTVKAQGLTVTAVSYTGTAGSSTQTNATITLSATPGTATTTSDAIYISGDRNNESDGLRNICSTGRTLHQINSSTYPIWDSNVKAAASGSNVANPSEDLFMQLVQQIRARSGKNIDVFVTSLGVQRRLANTYASQKRWNDASVTKIDGGYSAIMVAAGNQPVPVVSDVDCPAGYAFAINKSSFCWTELNRPGFLESPDGNGSSFVLKDGSAAGSKVAVWQAWIRWYSTLACVAPLWNGAITNLADDVPIVRF
jgi:hypothetical protein